MPLLKRKRVLAAKIEATPGTAETLTAAEATFNAYEVTIQQEIEVTPREGQGSFGHLYGMPGARKGKVTFKTDLGWDGSATEPAWADTFFPGCGVVKATNTFTPRSEVPGSNVKTLTIAVYENGMKKQIRGAVGTFKLVCETGKIAMLEWEFTGIWDAPIDATILAPTYTTDVPCRYASGVTTYNAVALAVQSVTLDVGNEVYIREGTAASNPTGYIAGCVTNRRPIITCNPESELVATQPRFGIFLTPEQNAFVFEIAGPSTSKIVITAPKASIESIQEADRSNIQVDDITLLCGQNGSTADQEFSIVFTP